MNTFFNWLTRSSVDPENTALTVKGLLLANVSTILFVLQLLHINWSADQVSHEIQVVTVVIGILLSIVGLVRKLYITFSSNTPTLPPVAPIVDPIATPDPVEPTADPVQ